MSITFVCATKMTSAANAIILQFTHPVFLILILWIFYHKRPDKRAILTCIIALIGIVCFFFDKITSGGMLGNLLAIICGETIGPMSIAGGVLVIGSVLAYSLSQIKRPVSAG